jgi:hypothetical protein
MKAVFLQSFKWSDPCCNMQWSPTCKQSSATAMIVVGDENGSMIEKQNSES